MNNQQLADKTSQSDRRSVPGESESALIGDDARAGGRRDRSEAPASAVVAAPGAIAATDGVDSPAGEHERSIARRLAMLSSPAVALPAIAALGVLLYIVNLGGAPLYTKGESREAVTVFDIVHGGGVILPMRAGVEIPSKPLLMHWLAALVSLSAGGVGPWTVRLPSAMLAIGGMIITYLYVRRLFEARGALFSAIMLGTSFQYLQAGTGSRVDMTLTIFMSIAFFEFLAIAEGLDGRPTLLYLAIAMAVLTKGPIGAALPALVAFSWIVVTWRWSLLRRLDLVRGALMIGIVGGGWYIAAIVSGGSAFVHKQILGENLYRLIGHRGFNEGHAHPFYYEEGALLAGFMPWTPIALLAAIHAIRRPRRVDARLGYLIVWFLVVLVFYNLPQSKRGVYLLGFYPALTTIIALYLSDAITHREATARLAGWISRCAGAFFVLAAIAGITGLGLLRALPEAISWILARAGILSDQLPDALRTTAHRWGLITFALPVVIAAIGLFLLKARPRVEHLLFATAGGFAAIALAVNLVVEPAVANTLTLEGFAHEAMQTAGGGTVGYFGSLDYNFAFYSGRNIQFVLKKDNDFDYIVCSEDDYRLMWPAMRQRYAIVLRSGPTDFDGTGRMILLKRASNPPAPPSPATAPAAAPGKKSPVVRIANQESRVRRKSETAAASRGRISPVGPRRLMLQSGVISDS